MAEVDFTRHVLICKLQRLENKLEESLSTIDYNNNTLTDEKGRSVEEIRDEMTKEYRDLRKLLQETSTQLKQVLDEKPAIDEQGGDINDGETPQGRLSTACLQRSVNLAFNFIIDAFLKDAPERCTTPISHTTKDLNCQKKKHQLSQKR